ncbi:MAG: DUF362 domain-containing protein [Deltaproteobacteria bacterium]|nr:DUF362 domain-containing protein [Deltaproteobacteria bacterium]
MKPSSPGTALTRRRFIGGVIALGGLMGVSLAFRKKLMARLSSWTELESFRATPRLVPHDSSVERRVLHIARGGAPSDNIDSVISKLGGMGTVVGQDDVVLIKVSAQWWNQGMTNVAAVKRVIEHVLEVPGFRGEVVVFENTHFRLPSGSGLSRAFTHPSERNVDVAGWNKLGDLIPYFEAKKSPVGFVGLVDGGPSLLAHDHWHDAGREHGMYGGDGRGPIAPGEVRDGYYWDFGHAFAKRRSWVERVKAPLTWPVFFSPRSGLMIDLKYGVFTREGNRRIKVDRKITFINMTTCNEHASTGLTCCCKSAMGIVDMSAGRMGSHPLARDYRSVHYFGSPGASWRMAGPLAQFAREVRAPDLYITVAEWVAITPTKDWNSETADIRLAKESAFHVNTVVAGADPVAIDWWCAKKLVMPLPGARNHLYDLNDPGSMLTKFLRYYREVNQKGTMDDSLIEVT